VPHKINTEDYISERGESNWVKYSTAGFHISLFYVCSLCCENPAGTGI